MSNWLEFDKFAVFGVGRSGVAAANLLARRGKDVVASDTRSLQELADAAEKLADSVELVGGGNEVGDAQVVVVSPGLKPRLEVFEELREREIPVISEIELAWAVAEAPILAITGTDGKSTTTVLTGHIIEQAGIPCVVGGNLGTPLCELVEQVDADGCIVAEVSAFQLWSTHDFAPKSVGFTNIAFDHLDYFDSYEEYVEAKKTAMANVGEAGWGVFNAEDAHLSAWADKFEGRAVAYGLSEEAVEGYADALWQDGEGLSARLGGEEIHGWLPDTKNLPITGPHNLLNLMCAAALAHSVGVDLGQVYDAMQSFEPLPHRFEYCGEVDGVTFFDDSKATNVNAALAGLRSIEGRFVPIIGGVDKGLELDELVAFLGEQKAPVVLLGEIRERLAAELRRVGHRESRIHLVDSLDEAVRLAHSLAGPGETVSLSPACSSFDMFDSYAHRGEVFQKLVAELRNEAVPA